MIYVLPIIWFYSKDFIRQQLLPYQSRTGISIHFALISKALRDARIKMYVPLLGKISQNYLWMGQVLGDNKWSVISGI